MALLKETKAAEYSVHEMVSVLVLMLAEGTANRKGILSVAKWEQGLDATLAC